MVEVEGLKQQTIIREILNSYTAKIEKNPNYIAYELLNNDPLNDESVEYLCSQSELWLDQAKKKIECPDLDMLDYKTIHIWFEPDFESRLQNLFGVEDSNIKFKIIKKDLSQTENRRKPPLKSFK